MRFHEATDLSAILEALRAGGIEVLEVTLDTPGALDAVRAAAAEGASIGTGTVLTAEDVRRSADAGAGFVVSPAVIPDVIGTALELGVLPIPGAFSPSEVHLATMLGTGTVKLFPASTGGPAHLRALRGPFPQVRFVPTGGVAIADIGPFLDAGAAAIGMGGTLVGTSPPRSEADRERITSRSAEAVEAVRSWQIAHEPNP